MENKELISHFKVLKWTSGQRQTDRYALVEKERVQNNGKCFENILYTLNKAITIKIWIKIKKIIKPSLKKL